MAKIKNLKETEKALSQIESLIGSIKGADNFMIRGFDGDKYSVNFSIPNPGDYSTTFTANMLCKDKKKINSMVKRYRNKLIRDVKDILGEHLEIELSDEETSLVYRQGSSNPLYGIWIDEKKPFLIGSVYILHDSGDEICVVKQGNCDAIDRESVALISKKEYDIILKAQQEIYGRTDIDNFSEDTKEYFSGLYELRNIIKGEE